MAPLLSVFGTDTGVSVVPTTARATEAADSIAQRQRQAAALREIALSPLFTNEIYGPIPGFGQTEDDLMRNPAEMQYGLDFLRETVPQMGRNVLRYGAAARSHKNMIEHLELSWLAGMPGDSESELARECVQAAFEANDEVDVAMYGMADQYEYGFRGGELVYDLITRGPARNIIAPIAIIPRPITWFGFDHVGRPRFKPDGRDYPQQYLREYPRVPELKVMFGRAGELHTRYGQGFAELCYPTVYEIDIEYRKLRTLTERFGYPPMVVTCSCARGTAEHHALQVSVLQQWKNAIVQPGPTLSGHTEYRIEGTEGAYAAANATGNVLLQLIAAKEVQLESFIQGSGTVASNPNNQVGSFARDQSADSSKMYEAPSAAACKEAMLNRGFVRPIMLINFPTLPLEKWPRASIDASFGEDLRLFMELVEKAVSLGMPVEWATFSERTKIPIGQAGQPLLSRPTATVTALTQGDALNDSLKAFSEPVIAIRLRNGRLISVAPDTPILTSRGPKRAAEINAAGGEIIHAIDGIHPSWLRAA